MHPETDRLLDRLAHFFLPGHCLGCEEALPWRTQPLNLCSDCRSSIRKTDDEECRLCGARTATDAWLCVPCRRGKPSLDAVLSAWSYEPPIDQVIQGLKFRRLEYLAVHIAEALGEELPIGDGHDLVTAVPLHWRRQLQRGFNQSDLIARPLARRLGLPYRRILRRSRPTEAQSGLSRSQRKANVRNAFQLRRRSRGINVEGSRVLLIDDVTTTGATLLEASRALKLAGIRTVTAVVAARTPYARIRF